MLKLKTEVSKLLKKVVKLRAYEEFACNMDYSTSEVDTIEYLEDMISYAQIVVEDYRGYDLDTRNVKALVRWIVECEKFIQDNKIEEVTEAPELDIDIETRTIENKEKSIQIFEDGYTYIKACKHRTGNCKSSNVLRVGLNEDISFKTLMNMSNDDISKYRYVFIVNTDFKITDSVKIFDRISKETLAVAVEIIFD